MADSGGVSGQQPTARTDYAEVDNLVNEIMELMMDMEIKRIDHSPQKLFFESILPIPQQSVKSACANS